MSDVIVIHEQLACVLLGAESFHVLLILHNLKKKTTCFIVPGSHPKARITDLRVKGIKGLSNART